MALKRGTKIALGIVGGFFGVLLLAIILIPLFIDVDSYRPKIEQAANEHIQGKLELGKLSLSLWGEIKVTVDGLKLSDANGAPVVASREVYFHMPLLSVLSGSPSLVLSLDHPELLVVKNKKGKLNVLSFAKPKAAGSGAQETKSGGGGVGELPGIAKRARLTLEVKDALLTYRDELTHLDSQTKDLNIRLKDISLSRPMDGEIWANLDTTMGKILNVKGPIRLTVHLDPTVTDKGLEKAQLRLHLDADGLLVESGQVFTKRPGIPANIDANVSYLGQSAQVDQVRVKFHNAEVEAKGLVEKLDAEEPALGPISQFTFSAKPIALKPWSELVPMLKEYELGGVATLDGSYGGTTVAPKYAADLKVADLVAKAPHLKSQPKVNALIKVVTNKVERLEAEMRAAGNQVKLTGQVVDFERPKIDFALSSTGMDLDQLIDFPKTPAGGAAPAPAKGDAKTAGAATDYDKMVEPLRANPVLAGMILNGKYALAFVKAKGTRMSPVNGKIAMRQLSATLDLIKMGVFGGTVSLAGGVNLAPKTPSYTGQVNVDKLELQQAVASQFEMFKNTVLGKATFHMQLSGSSFNPDKAKAALNAKGGLRVDNPTFTSLDVGKMATEALAKAIQGVKSKIPNAGGINLNAPNREAKYESLTCDFSLSGGKFSAPNFFAKSLPNQGIDIKGDTLVGIIDYSLRANWQLIDTYNVTKARDVSIDVSGTRVDHILADGNSPVVFPVRVGGTLLAPQVDYGSVPEALGKVAFNNVARAAGERAKAEAKKAVQKEAEKALQGAPPAIKDLTKKLFGN